MQIPPPAAAREVMSLSLKRVIGSRRHNTARSSRQRRRARPLDGGLPRDCRFSIWLFRSPFQMRDDFRRLLIIAFTLAALSVASLDIADEARAAPSGWEA